MDYEELLEKCLEEGGRVKQDEVVVKILQIIDSLKNANLASLDETLVTRAIGKLSIYLVNLGELKDNAALEDETSTTYRKMKGVREYREVKSTVGTIKEADMIVEERLVDDYQRELTKHHSAESLKTLYKSVETVISVMQSRVKTLTSERMRANNQT